MASPPHWKQMEKVSFRKATNQNVHPSQNNVHTKSIAYLKSLHSKSEFSKGETAM